MKEKRISDILPEAWKVKPAQETRLRNAGIVDWEKVWAQECDEARNYSYVLKYTDSTLVVAVKNSAWILELKKREKELLKKLQSATGEKIKKIKFVR
ncbi:MAG: DciA family protein [Candidatus Omnitrophica bacterium]|nr:DciA family protein [Candidatus Omnitrophota bacterium]